MNFEGIYNYYEYLVDGHLTGHAAMQGKDTDYIQDVACISLNQLPVKYIRHAVDQAFYITPAERKQIQDDVEEAVDQAIRQIEKHRG